MNTNYNPYSILLAEDDPISRRLFEKILVKEGFSVTTVENGRKALDLIRKQFFPHRADRLADAGNGGARNCAGPSGKRIRIAMSSSSC